MIYNDKSQKKEKTKKNISGGFFHVFFFGGGGFGVYSGSQKNTAPQPGLIMDRIFDKEAAADK